MKPTQSAMASKWSFKTKCGEDLTDHKVEHTTYQYIPITETLRSLLENDQFYESYFDFDHHRKHTCTDDVFENFCCGSVYKENPVFLPTTLQLQLGIDDFEPCNALKTKTGLHKMCAVYLEIRNVDPRITSKLSQSHLVALAKTQDIKSGGTSDRIA